MGREFDFTALTEVDDSVREEILEELPPQTVAEGVRELDSDDAVRRKFKRAVTDSGTEIRFDPGRPAINNLLTIYHLLTGKTDQEVEAHFGGKGYASLKQELADVTIEFLKPIQERVQAIDDGKLNTILEGGAQRAEEIARARIADAKRKMGLVGARTPG